jgi:hypothetical protein
MKITPEKLRELIDVSDGPRSGAEDDLAVQWWIDGDINYTEVAERINQFFASEEPRARNQD